MELPELVVADAAAWRTWLDGNHATSQGVRLALAKKGRTHPTTLSYDEALDEAICFGWIDGQVGRRDSTTFQRQTIHAPIRSEPLVSALRCHRRAVERRGANAPIRR